MFRYQSVSIIDVELWKDKVGFILFKGKEGIPNMVILLRFKVFFLRVLCDLLLYFIVMAYGDYGRLGIEIVL